MGEHYPAKSFKSGNSVAIRIPAALGVEPNREWIVHRDEQGKLVIEAKPEQPRLIDLTGIAGMVPGLKRLSEEERRFEHRELDWEGKLLGRN